MEPAYSDCVIFLGLAPEDLYMFVPLNQTETEFDRKSAYSTYVQRRPDIKISNEHAANHRAYGSRSGDVPVNRQHNMLSVP